VNRICALAALAALAIGCGRRRSAEVQPAPPAPVTATPVDRTLPDELAEGKDQAYGLLLPRRMTVTRRFTDSIFAAGQVSAAQVSNYVRQHVVAERVETGPVKTVFSRATSRLDPGRVMRIEVVSRGAETEIMVRDETPPPVKPGLTDAERWREAGFNPDGTPVDPKSFE
jgi:hypothetical protein